MLLITLLNYYYIKVKSAAIHFIDVSQGLFFRRSLHVEEMDLKEMDLEEPVISPSLLDELLLMH